ncbi:MAG TPA: YihY family inner membrane protein, partial [Piscinibacter sp.]|nr:YihY family inner membrane protein [Piscinibacter sp.]
MNLPTHLKARLPESWRERIALLLETLQHWPWLETLRTLRLRFREDHLGLTASSLTFTTLISLVPLVTVTLAIFSAFPMFASFQEALQKYFLQSLVPDNIAKPVMAALTQFAAKANRLGSVGLVFLVLAALALMLTIDRTLNAIWRVRNPRPIAQRVLVYWAAATLGPLVLGVSLSLTSYVLSASKGIVSELPGGLSLLLNTIEFLLLAAGMASLFHYVPNTYVQWRHAIAGGVFVSVGFEVAKKGLAWYITQVPTFAVVYGAFATLPILLVWIYLGWVIVLLGAVIAAYAPSLQMHVARWPDRPGSRFGLALALLHELERARRGEARGLGL